MNGLKSSSLRRFVGASMMAAIVCVATLVHMPLPLVGYIHVGDAFVLLCGYLFGSAFGFGAAAVGSMLADIVLGYAAYAPATFVIKGLVALIAALLCRRVKARGVRGLALLFLFALVSECVMVGGYFVFEWVFYGSLSSALPGIFFNSLQGLISALVAAILMVQTKKMRFLSRF